MIYLKNKKEVRSEAGVSILDLALNQGLVLEHSCKMGLCGVCKAQVIDGQTKTIIDELALNEDEQKSGFILTCCRYAVEDVYLQLEDLPQLANITVQTLPVRIDSLEQMSDSIISIILRFPPTVSFNFLEGQYIDVIESAILKRSYSIASSSSNNQVSLLIKMVKGGLMSDYWFNKAVVNDLLRIEGPKGTFFLRNADCPLVFLATGTGIAPIMSILNRLDEDEAFIQLHDIYLFWGNRKPEDFIWKPKFKKLKVKMEYVLSVKQGQWLGEIGFVQDVALSKIKDITKFDVYASGSHNMILTAKQAFFEAGLNESSFYSDSFVQSC